MGKLQRIFVLFTFIFFCTISFACSRKQQAIDRSFQSQFPIEMNAKIRLFDVDKSNVFKIDEIVSLGIENISQELIKFPSDYGIKLLTYDVKNDKWIEVPNDMRYSSGERQISAKGVNSPGIKDVGFHPKLTGVKQQVELRVVVIGTPYIDNTPSAEKTGAYIDITLQP